MAYYIQRQSQQYGPYSLDDIKRYIAQGNIVLADMARSDGMTAWQPLWQLIGSPQPAGAPSTAAPVPVPAVVAQSPATVAYAGAAPQQTRVLPGVFPGPMPPDFHWALVLLLGCLTFGIFSLVWLCIQASFVKKIRPASDFVVFLVLGLIPLIGIVFFIIGLFKMRDAIREYYNTVEPINLRLSGVMTFFFAVYYFQHHFSRIADWKRTGYLQPQY